MIIEPSQVKHSEMSTGDDVGRVFHWNGGIYRAINKNKVADVKELFDCGLIPELIKADLIPDTKITQYTLGDSPMVLSHATIKSVTYPFEWSFEMMKAAALTILRVNEISMKYGYQTKDAHSFNVLFDGTHPYYIDIGSFTKVSKDTKHFIWYTEYLTQYPFMFYIAKTNEYHWVKQLSASDMLITFEAYLLYRYKWLRRFDLKTARRVAKLWKFFNIGDAISDDQIRQKKFGSILVLFRKMFGSGNKTIADLKADLQKAKKKPNETMWGEYQSKFEESNTRFNRLIEIMSGHNIKTVFEVAANQGFFSNMLLTKAGVEHSYCTDYDDNAVDTMFLKYPDRRNLSPVLMNFLFQPQTSFTLPAPARFKSDLVVALAIMHHIILTQGQSVDFFLTTLLKYSNKYILVEFMPIGLWNSESDKAPPVPDWYNVDWFRTHFVKYFKILHEEEVAKNRIAFFGEKI